MHRDVAFDVDSDPGQTHRLFRGSALGTGYAGNAYADFGVHQGSHTASHGASHLFTDRASALDEFRINAKLLDLHGVVVGNDATQKRVKKRVKKRRPAAR